MTFFLALFAAAAMSHPCTGAQLAGTFAAVPNSEGAGNIVYKLTLHNASKTTCYVTGLPQVKLLDKGGRAQPTHPIPANRGALTAVLVTLTPDAKTTATARFSPDVPGVGEGHMGQCEPTSYWLRVTPNGGGTLRAPIQPPTAVCEHGGMTWSVLTRS